MVCTAVFALWVARCYPSMWNFNAVNDDLHDERVPDRRDTDLSGC
jgi:hypothetical protein